MQEDMKKTVWVVNTSDLTVEEHLALEMPDTGSVIIRANSADPEFLYADGYENSASDAHVALMAYIQKSLVVNASERLRLELKMKEVEQRIKELER